MPARKPKRYVGRVYLGQGDDGKQLWHWVGRFDRKKDRDDAVARAKVEKPWEAAGDSAGMTVDQWCDRFLERMESGALRTKSGRRFKDSSIDTARSSLLTLRDEFGPALYHQSRSRGLGREGAPEQDPDCGDGDERRLPRRGDRPKPLRGP